MAQQDSLMLDGSPLWQFSIAFYRRPGVQAACLALQDAGGADVNVVLYLFFSASENRQLGKQSILSLDQHIAVWRQTVVQPLRSVRRGLKEMLTEIDAADCDEITKLRANIKRDELTAEKLQQQKIYDFGLTLVGDGVPWHEAGQANLRGYETICQLSLPSGAREQILAEFADFMNSIGD